MKLKNISTLIFVLTFASVLVNGQSTYQESLKKTEGLDFFERIDSMVGKPIFKFYGKTYKGEKLTSDSIMGKVAIINFWFMSCQPCIAELSGLNEIVKKFENETEVKFISFTLNSKEILEKDFFPNYEFYFKIIPNSEEFIWGDLKHPFGFPTTFVVDKKGIIRKLIIGGRADEEQAKKDIKLALIPIIEKCLKEN